MILNIICNNSLGLIHDPLMSILSLISIWFWNLLSDVLIQIILFKDEGDSVLSCSEVINPSKLVLKLRMVSHFFKSEPQIEIAKI